MVALYNATDGANWTNSWDLNADPTTWHGVVTAVYFPGGGGASERHIDEINLFIPIFFDWTPVFKCNCC